MATGSHVLQQQRGSLETRIKLLINTDLKEICKAYGYQVSGKKDALQKRCIEILADICKSGNETAFNDLNYRVAHHGHPPPQAYSNGAGSSNSSRYGNSNSNTMAPRGGSSNRPPSTTYFKSSPFYDTLETLIQRQDLPGFTKEMPQNKNTVNTQLVLNPDQAARLKADPSLRILLYCGVSSGMSHFNPADVTFPNQIEVKINGDDVRANFKGLKNKPGSTKPADITEKVRKVNNYPNKLAVTYALTTKRYAFEVYLVKYNTAESLTEKIKAGKHGGGIIRKEHVLNEMSKANSDSDLAATSTRMSLKDPISTLRITLPVRSSVCRHNQCFDGAMFMALQDQAPQWTCPVCSRGVTYESLCVDQYFQEILREAEKRGPSVEKVDIEPNGEYKLLTEDDIVKPPGHSSKEARAAYDDDFDDDDVVEVDEAPPKPAMPAYPKTASSMLSPAPPAYAMNTPPLSSRGASVAPSMSSNAQSQKRPASTVIDLTLSDDEDEPPRPAKRQSTSSRPGNSRFSTPSYSNHSYPSYSTGQGPSTDSYRPSGKSSSGVNGASSGSGFRQYASQQNGNPSYGSSSSWRSSANGSPAYSTFGSLSNEQRTLSSASWGSHNSRPAIGSNAAPPSFPSSYPMTSFTSGSSGPTNGNSGVRLPPMQTHPSENFTSGWRGGSGFSSYSQSPPG